MIRKHKVGLAGAWLIACFCLPCIPGVAQNDPVTDALNAGAIGEDPAVAQSQAAAAPPPSLPAIQGSPVPRPSDNRTRAVAPQPPSSAPSSNEGNNSGPAGINNQAVNAGSNAGGVSVSPPSTDGGATLPKPEARPTPSSERQGDRLSGSQGGSASFGGYSDGGTVGSDQFSSGDEGIQMRTNQITGSQTESIDASQAPTLQGATNGTIGPQAGDATVIEGVNTAGTVRVNNLANLEALLNVMANGLEILGIAWGGPTMIMGFLHMGHSVSVGLKRALWGAVGVSGGLAMPSCVNWLVASARDANLFS